MGSFPGHFLPGLFFTSFAFWWMTQLYKRKRLCEVKGIPFYSTVTFPCGYGKCLDWPAEGIIKIVATAIGMAGETYAAFDYGESSTIVSLGDIQHVTMYSFFCLSGICDVLQTKCSWLPPGLDYMALAAAFSVEGILFRFHLHGRSELDSHIHILLVGTIAASVISILLEYNNPNSLLACGVRTYLICLQGTWFVQVGFILYNPIPGSGIWRGDDPGHMMLATTIFVWHAIGVFLFMFLVVSLTTLCRNRYCPVTKYTDEYDLVGYHSYRYELLSHNDNSEDEEEELIDNSNNNEHTATDMEDIVIVNGNMREHSNLLDEEQTPV